MLWSIRCTLGPSSCLVNFRLNPVELMASHIECLDCFVCNVNDFLCWKLHSFSKFASGKLFLSLLCGSMEEDQWLPVAIPGPLPGPS
jgi:hypothetical protein